METSNKCSTKFDIPEWYNKIKFKKGRDTMTNIEKVATYIANSSNRDRLLAAFESLFGKPRIQRTKPVDEERSCALIDILSFDEVSVFNK